MLGIKIENDLNIFNVHRMQNGKEDTNENLEINVTKITYFNCHNVSEQFNLLKSIALINYSQ